MMQTDQISMVHNLLQLIEENIREDLDLDVLAEETDFQNIIFIGYSRRLPVNR